jgi:sugar lactone lactonase YvrE
LPASISAKVPERSYAYKTLPRPTAKPRACSVTEYDLPRKNIMPHDVIVDSDGMVWYSDFGALFIGKMDPQNRQGHGISDSENQRRASRRHARSSRKDQEGNVWVAMMYQGGVARLDKKTGKVQTWSVPKEWQTDATQQSFASPTSVHVDGKVWVKNSDRATNPAPRCEDRSSGRISAPSPIRTRSGPSAPTASTPTATTSSICSTSTPTISAFLDGATKKLEVHKTSILRSRPRRGRVDEQNRLWFAEYDGNGVGMYDPKTKAIREWVVPTAWSNPYDVVVDKNGDAWTGSMMTDRVTRINTKTGEMTEYLLPNSTNIRRVWVDNSTTPVSFWVGSNHGASIVKLQPLE